ncbi:hypothetical protein FRC10_010181 [Ceratobasidium sp. 414]|nr:hypothetical protein FRC10_010181 [Ceratobasidium sp. 414]
MSAPPIRVLITNDDGPPAKDSPYVLGLYLELRKLAIRRGVGKAMALVKNVMRPDPFKMVKSGNGSSWREYAWSIFT